MWCTSTKCWFIIYTSVFADESEFTICHIVFKIHSKIGNVVHSHRKHAILLLLHTYFVEDTDIIGIRRLIPRDHFVIKYVDVNGQLRRRGLSVSVLRKQLLPLSEWFVLLNIDFVNSFTAIGDKIGFCKQHRSRWDSSMSHLIWIYAVWHSVFQLYI